MAIQEEKIIFFVDGAKSSQEHAQLIFRERAALNDKIPRLEKRLNIIYVPQEYRELCGINVKIVKTIVNFKKGKTMQVKEKREKTHE